MKRLQNPTTFFFKQAQNVTDHFTKQIEQFSNKLLNKDQCQLCLQKYDLLVRLPRIMIHCGHTFCTPCLKEFYMNRRVRCPMCLKLVKQLDKLERLPINHTIFTYLVEKDKKNCEKSGLKPITTDASKTLFSQFEKAQKQAHIKQNPQKIDPDSGLPFCVFHPDRVQHFYCATHSSAGCRICSQIGHSKPDCKVIDLYQIQEPSQLTSMISKNQQYPQQTHYQQHPNKPNQQIPILIGRTGAGKQKIVSAQQFVDPLQLNYANHSLNYPINYNNNKMGLNSINLSNQEYIDDEDDDEDDDDDIEEDSFDNQNEQ